ncbi:hypothetical protein E2I00_004815, partial [Balaenoptera physalus]
MTLAECECEGWIQATGWWWGSCQPTLWHLRALRGPGAGDALSLPEVFAKVRAPGILSRWGVWVRDQDVTGRCHRGREHLELWGLLVSVSSARKAAWVGQLLLGPAFKDTMHAGLPPGAVSVHSHPGHGPPGRSWRCLEASCLWSPGGPSSTPQPEKEGLAMGQPWPVLALRAGYLMEARPANACHPIEGPRPGNGSLGAIVLIRRYNCTFDLKVLHAQRAGFQAAIVYNVRSDDLVLMVHARASRRAQVRTFTRLNDLCAICLDEYEEGDQLKILPCSHIYHCKCIDPWFSQAAQRSCPVCKQSVARTEDGSDS